MKQIEYFVDSELVARQLSGEYRVRNPQLKALFGEVRERQRFFEAVTFSHLPRTHEKIRYVDKLVNQALNLEGY